MKPSSGSESGTSHDIKTRNCMNSTLNVLFVDCDGSILNTYSQCCPDSSVVCPHASRKCRDNLQAGGCAETLWSIINCTFILVGFSAAFCPLSHPHACNNGKLCSKDPHKPLSSVQGCNGMAVKPSDTCCPDSSLPCSNWDSSLTCASNPEFGTKKTNSFIFPLILLPFVPRLHLPLVSPLSV